VPDESIHLLGRERHDVSELRSPDFEPLSHDVVHEYRAATP